MKTRRTIARATTGTTTRTSSPCNQWSARRWSAVPTRPEGSSERSPQTRRPSRSFDDLLQFGAFFSGRGLAPLAIEVLRQAIADSPTPAAAHLALGRALESAGDLQAAIASYQRARALNADRDDAQRQIQWAQDRVAARARPVAVSQEIKERYAGQYQQQAVAVRNGRLYYKGAVSPESALTPIAEDLFEVDADPTLRIRFVGDGTRPAVKLIGIYSDGSMDEWARSQ